MRHSMQDRGPKDYCALTLSPLREILWTRNSQSHIATILSAIWMPPFKSLESKLQVLCILCHAGMRTLPFPLILSSTTSGKVISHTSLCTDIFSADLVSVSLSFPLQVLHLRAFFRTSLVMFLLLTLSPKEISKESGKAQATSLWFFPKRLWYKRS